MNIQNKTLTAILLTIFAPIYSDYTHNSANKSQSLTDQKFTLRQLLCSTSSDTITAQLIGKNSEDNKNQSSLSKFCYSFAKHIHITPIDSKIIQRTQQLCERHKYLACTVIGAGLCYALVIAASHIQTPAQKPQPDDSMPVTEPVATTCQDDLPDVDEALSREQPLEKIIGLAINMWHMTSTWKTTSEPSKREQQRLLHLFEHEILYAPLKETIKTYPSYQDNPLLKELADKMGTIDYFKQENQPDFQRLIDLLDPRQPFLR